MYCRTFVASLLLYPRGQCWHVVGTQVCVERVGVPNVVGRDFLSCFFFSFVNCLCSSVVQGICFFTDLRELPI